MTLKIELTHGWSQERMLPMWPSILEDLRKFINRFPDDMTEEYLIQEIMSGSRLLWVIYDEEAPEHAVMCVVTETKKNMANGKMFIEIVGMGGNRMHECLPLEEEIAKWGIENHGIKEMVLIGRPGWKRLLDKYGYKETAVIMRKQVEGCDNGRTI